MILVDTNVVSELRNPRTADRNVMRWSERERGARWCLSAITILELRRGVLLALRRDPAKGAVLESWLDGRLLPAFAGAIIPVDTAVALACAPLHVPDPRPERDALIAATAIAHGLTLATRNVRDFEGLGLTVVNPWDATD